MQIFYLTEIGHGLIKTRGTLIINYNGNKIKFHLVRGNFPIKSRGILGMQFSRKNYATMSFSDKEIILQIKSANLVQTKIIELRARTRKLIKLHIKNNSLKEGCKGHIDLLAPAYKVLALHAFRGVAGLQGRRFEQSALGSQREPAHSRLETARL